MDRRKFLASAAAAAVTPVTALAGRKKDRERAALAADMAAALEDQLQALGGTRVLGTRIPGQEATSSVGTGFWKTVPSLDPDLAAKIAEGVRYWDLPAASRPTAGWPSEDRHPDTFHLKDYPQPAGRSFELDADLLRGLCTANAFVLGAPRPWLFGIRGATLAEGVTDSGPATRHGLTLAQPDHVHRRCVIGVWSADDQLRLFSASTVPQIGNMVANLDPELKAFACSLLPAGRYRYVTGTHAAGTDRPQAGALRNVDEYVVLRAAATVGDAPGVLSYDPFIPYDAWTKGAAHNLHSANTGSVFNSSGCQVVRGGYDKARTTGTEDWLAFQVAAGLTDAKGVPGVDGRPYDYVLFPGVEALLYANGDPSFRRDYLRLRPGSEGPRVQAMREKLVPEIPDLFGQPTPPPGPQFDWMTAFLVLEAHERDATVKERVGPVWRG